MKINISLNNKNKIVKLCNIIKEGSVGINDIVS